MSSDVVTKLVEKKLDKEFANIQKSFGSGDPEADDYENESSRKNYKKAEDEVQYQAEMDRLNRKEEHDRRKKESDQRAADIRAKYGIKEPPKEEPKKRFSMTSSSSKTNSSNTLNSGSTTDQNAPARPPPPTDDPNKPKAGAKSKAMCAGMGCTVM